jgi:tetratricopeptide (TPR) repeat protein
MKFSNIYILYPDNRALERAIASSLGMLSEELVEAATPDTQVTTADNFLHTRGNYEQRSFSTNIFESMREVLEAALTDEYRAQDATNWALKQNSLGNILAGLGQLQRDEASYEKAIQCFNNALEEFSQEESALEWAATQYNLGTASQALGRLRDDRKALKKAVDAYTNALLVWSRDETPEDWMFAMHQLGATFHSYGKLLKGNRTFQKSVVAYKNALAVLDADNYPLELSATHNNRAAVLHHLGESEENPERLIEAIKSYEKALTVCMEQQRPFHLAVIMRVNKATAQNVLAEITNDAALAEEVADEFELIMECFPHVLQPLCLKHCDEQMSKAKSLALLNSASG